jgi:acyl-CoA synthetase (NDP forming)
VLLKAGLTPVGARAAGSHTAACAAPNNAADALLIQSGVIRVATLEELFDVTALLAMQPLPAGPRVAILSNAGGPAVLAADMLAARGLQVPELSDALQARLRQFLPSEAVARNPIDLIGAIDERQFGECLGVLLGCDEVDSILSIYVPRLAGTTPQIVQAVLQVAAANVDDKPVVLVCMDAQFKPEAWRYADRQLPVYAYPERAAAALARAVAYVRWRDTPRMPAPALTAEQRRAVRAVIDRHASELPRDGAWLPVADVWELVSAAGLPVPLQRHVSSAAAAARFAEEVQGGVVLKAISPALLHKADQGGVILGVVGPSAAHAAYEQLVRTVPDTTGIWAQEFVAGGSEWMLGVVHDEQFGHLIGFGLGGTLVEAVGQVQFRVQPLTDCDARELVASHPASRLLDGCRTVAPADQDALQQAILRLSALLDVAPEIDEADFNPVIALPEGQGVRFVDARVHLSRADLS